MKKTEQQVNDNKPAFTLIEILVVIAVIGILTTLAVVSLQNSRRSARDAKRVADAKQIQNALELYYTDNNAYPDTLIPGETLSSGSVIYIQQIPSAPTPNDGDCSEQENGFTYVTSKLQFDYFNVVANGTNHNTYYQCSNSNNYYNIYFCLSANTGSFLAGKVIASSQGLNSWTCGDSFLDYRDEQFYKTVQIENKCWMAENLNYDDGCGLASFSEDPGQANWCGCYNNNSSSCDTFGKLYQWRAAMKESESEEAQGICPDGWHIPDEDEIDEMIDYVTTNYSDHGCITKSLASQYNWIPCCEGFCTSDICYYGSPAFMSERNNVSGLSFIPSGWRDPGGTYDQLYSYSTLWSSSLVSYPNVFAFRFFQSDEELDFYNEYLSFALSVRCVK